MSEASFPKSVRLRKRPEFLRVQDRGEKLPAGPFLLLALRSESGGPGRLGITVSTKVGNAVTRARIRRHVREFFRKRRSAFPQGVDVVVIARGSAKEASVQLMRDALDTVLPKLQKRFQR